MLTWKECFHSTAYLGDSHLKKKKSHYIIKQPIAFVLLFFQIKVTHVEPQGQLCRRSHILQP